MSELSRVIEKYHEALEARDWLACEIYSKEIIKELRKEGEKCE